MVLVGHVLVDVVLAIGPVAVGTLNLGICDLLPAAAVVLPGQLLEVDVVQIVKVVTFTRRPVEERAIIVFSFIFLVNIHDQRSWF